MKKIFTLILSVGIASSCFAYPITAEQALSRAMGSAPQKIRGQRASLALKITKTFNEQNTIYVFSGNDSFVIAPADDILPAVLGYGDNGITTPSGEVPENFSYWLDFLSQRAARAVEQGSVPRYVRPERAPIAKLCSTEWNQGSPYNNQCPMHNGARSVTGCVATSMAQAVKYHNYPAKGIGTSSYYWENGGRTLTFDYENMTFDWENMINNYDTQSYTTTQARAVSTLMSALGGSVEMIYSSSSSGAYSANIANALVSHFGYSQSVQYLLRDYYSLMEWEEIIYHSLSEYGPVIYGGQAPVGGHSFICDGYQGEGYFHINWGWGGTSDGYFLLDMLDPQNQGIGGASGYAFNESQDAVVKLHPDTAQNSVKTPPMLWGNYGYTSEISKNYSPGDEISIYGSRIVENTGFWNYGPFVIPSTTKYGIAYEDMYTGDIVFNGEEIGGELSIYYGFRDATEYLPSLSDGIYKIYIGLQTDGDPYPVKTLYGKRPFIIGTVTDGKTRLSYPQISMPIVEGIAYPDSCSIESPVINVTARLTNNGPDAWDTSVRIELYKDNHLYAYGESVQLSGESGDTTELEYTSTVLTHLTEQPDLTANPSVDGTTGGDDSEGATTSEELQIVLTVKNGSSDSWLPITNYKSFKLTGIPTSTGISEVFDTNSATETWYDLQGRKVKAGNTKGGIFINSEGKKSVRTKY